MLVYVKVGFNIKGYTQLKTNGFSKKYTRQEITLLTGASFVCDEDEVMETINNVVAKEMSTSKGWGKDFEGWTRWEYSHGSNSIHIQYINDMKMSDIINKLTGEQFKRFMNE